MQYACVLLSLLRYGHSACGTWHSVVFTQRPFSQFTCIKDYFTLQTINFIFPCDLRENGEFPSKWQTNERIGRYESMNTAIHSLPRHIHTKLCDHINCFRIQTNFSYTLVSTAVRCSMPIIFFDIWFKMALATATQSRAQLKWSRIDRERKRKLKYGAYKQPYTYTY